MPAPRPAISMTSAMCESAAGRPAARQYMSRLARPDRCGREAGPPTTAPRPDKAGEPAEPRQRGPPGVDLPAEDRDRARVGMEQAHQRPQGRGLARAVGPEQAQ